MSQFHYGSITTLNSVLDVLIFLLVSIPLWFDYNVKIGTVEWNDDWQSLNSTMVRLQHYYPY